MNVHASSFRDPAAFVFRDENIVHRQINKKAASDYDLLISSGLYDALVTAGKLISHTEQKDLSLSSVPEVAYRIITPQQIPFISYPYEWSFSQLKDAALLTLSIQKMALQHGMSLKDASAYNVQFCDGVPKFIDTVSFEKYDGKDYWVAYKQFCQHFLAPLCLMAYRDVRLSLLLSNFIDGIPLELAASLLPRRARLKFGVFLHVYVHGLAQQKYADKEGSPHMVKHKVQKDNSSVSQSLTGLLNNLEHTIKTVHLPRALKTAWGEYYTFTNYSGKSFQSKKRLVAQYVQKTKAKTVFDLGGNEGTFSRVAMQAGAKEAVCFDSDPLAVEKNYNQVKHEHEANVLPLLLDLTNPSPGLGWGNMERHSIVERSRPKQTVVLALALVHHLAIANNVPFALIAEYFSKLGKHLIIEFVPKGDSKVEKLLSTREDIFDTYDEANFEKSMKNYYTLLEKKKIVNSKRTLYLFRVRVNNA